MFRFLSVGAFLLFLGCCCLGAAGMRARAMPNTPPGFPAPDTAGLTAIPDPPEDWPDSLLTVFYYTEGVKRAHVYGDIPGAMRLLARAVEIDSLHSPSYFEMANSLLETDRTRALGYSLTANSLDTANLWYKGQLGELLVANGEFRQAQSIYEDLIRRSPRNPDNYTMLAVLFEYSGQPFSAIATLDRAESVIGKMEHIAAYKRKLLVDVKLYDRAIDENKALLDIYPHNYESHLSLAELYAMRGKDSLAEAGFARALELNPGSPEVILAMNEYYKVKGNDAKYIETAKELFRSKGVPADAKVKWMRDAFNNLDFCRENYFHIREMAATAYVMYPGNYDVLDVYSQTLIFSGELETALRHHKAFLNDTLTVIKPYTDVIDMEAYLDRPDSVRKYVDVAVGRFPRNSELYVRQAVAYRYMNDDKKTIAAYSKAVEYAPDDSTRSMVSAFLAGYYQDKGNEKKAMSAYNKAVQYAPDGNTRSTILGVIGDYFHTKGDDSKAFKYYKDALANNPDNVVVLNNYAYYLSLVGKDMENALEMSARVMELEGSNATYIDTYAWVLYKMERYEDAKKAMRQAIALDPDNSPELLSHYAEILHAMGDTYLATVYWKRAIEAGGDSIEISKRIEQAENKAKE